MAFLGRGNVALLHHPNAQVVVTRTNGQQWCVRLREISCYEEHLWHRDAKITSIYFTNNTMIVVRESFDQITALLAEQEAPHVV